MGPAQFTEGISLGYGYFSTRSSPRKRQVIDKMQTGGVALDTKSTASPEGSDKSHMSEGLSHAGVLISSHITMAHDYCAVSNKRTFSDMKGLWFKDLSLQGPSTPA